VEETLLILNNSGKEDIVILILPFHITHSSSAQAPLMVANIGTACRKQWPRLLRRMKRALQPVLRSPDGMRRSCCDHSPVALFREIPLCLVAPCINVLGTCPLSLLIVFLIPRFPWLFASFRDSQRFFQDRQVLNIEVCINNLGIASSEGLLTSSHSKKIESEV
jgi:hypothetical protein